MTVVHRLPASMTAPLLAPEVGPDGELIYGSAAVVHLAGVTYRQLDYWARSGLIPDTAQGSGHARVFTAGEIDVIRLAKHLIDVGFTVPAAFRIAGHAIAYDGWTTAVADIFTLAITVNTPPPTEEHTS